MIAFVAALGIGLVTALALCGVAPAAGYPSCTWTPYTPEVTGGATVTVTVTCSSFDPADQYALRVTESAGLTASVAPAGTPNTFTLTIAAPADARAAYPTVVLAVDGAAYPTQVRVPVSVRRIPTPDCFVQDNVTTPAGTSQEIYVRCQGSGRDGETSTLEIIEQPTHGRLTAAASGLGWTYTPDRGFVGADRLAFRARNAFGTSPDFAVAIRVRKPTSYELDAEYYARVCGLAPGGRTPRGTRPGRGRATSAARGPTSCRAGRGRRTSGGSGTGKVSHRNWPAIDGVYYTFPGGGGGRLEGGERTDELLGHHGSDTIFGGAGDDILWGDWDPNNNNGSQSDHLNGGPGSDFIYTSHGRNTVTGGPGNDFIWAFYGHGTIDCGPGTDKIRLSGREGAYKLRSCERRGTF